MNWTDRKEPVEKLKMQEKKQGLGEGRGWYNQMEGGRSALETKDPARREERIGVCIDIFLGFKEGKNKS